MRAFILFAMAMSLGCLQLTGVADYKVEETPAAPACTPPPGSACRVAPNCGCADGQTCGIASAEGAGVCHAAGSAANEEPCAALEECAKGLACVGSMCLPYCATDADCPTKQCEIITIGDPPQQVKGIGVCRRPCNPDSADCGEGFTCAPTSDTRFSCVRS